MFGMISGTGASTLRSMQQVPKRFAGLKLWLDASDSSSLGLSGASLTSWSDLSGNNNTAVPFETGAGSPQYSATSFNKKPGITFSAGQGFKAPSATGTFSSAVTLFVVFKKVGAANATYADGLVAKTKANIPAPFDIYDMSRFEGDGNGFGNCLYTLDMSTATNWNFYSAVMKLNSWSEWVNGVSVSYTSGSYNSCFTDNSSYLYIGTREDKNTKFAGIVAEIIVYSTELTSAQRLVVEDYLLNKWDIYYYVTGTYTETLTANYSCIKFTGDGTIRFTKNMSGTTCELTVVVLSAGGGGAGGKRQMIQNPQTGQFQPIDTGGGGGAGGRHVLANLSVTKDSVYTIAVGTGGAGGGSSTSGSAGGSSTLTNTTTSTTYITCTGGSGGTVSYTASAASGTLTYNSTYVTNVQNKSGGTGGQGGYWDSYYSTTEAATSGSSSDSYSTGFTGIPSELSSTVLSVYAGGGGGGDANGGGAGSSGAGGTQSGSGSPSGASATTNGSGGGGGAKGTTASGGSGKDGVVYIYFKRTTA